MSTMDRAQTDFNPRSREGSDPDTHIMRSRVPISIHAPVKGATLDFVIPRGDKGISIHAPVKGATPYSERGML